MEPLLKNEAQAKSFKMLHCSVMYSQELWPPDPKKIRYYVQICQKEQANQFTYVPTFLPSSITVPVPARWKPSLSSAHKGCFALACTKKHARNSSLARVLMLELRCTERFATPGSCRSHEHELMGLRARLVSSYSVSFLGAFNDGERCDGAGAGGT